MTHPTADAAIAASRASGGEPEWCESTRENYDRLREVSRVDFVSGPPHDPWLSYHGKFEWTGTALRIAWTVNMRKP